MTEEPRLPKKPMKFGSEEDFHVAIAELKWIKSLQGNLKGETIEQVASKYLFPPEFLKAGLKGLELEDFKITECKWFPIIYAWQRHDNNKVVQDVWRQASTYAKTRHDFILLLLITPALVILTIQILLIIGASLFYILPVAGIIVSASITLWRRSEDRAEKLEATKRLAEQEGLGESADNSIQFALSHPLLSYYTQKKGEPLSLTLFPLGLIERERPTGRFSRFLNRFSLGRRIIKVKKERTLVSWAEDPEIAYTDRLKELLKK